MLLQRRASPEAYGHRSITKSVPVYRPDYPVPTLRSRSFSFSFTITITITIQLKRAASYKATALRDSLVFSSRVLQIKHFQTMGDAIDLTGDGGVIKTILKRSKIDAVGPTEDFPLVDVHYEGTLADTDKVFDTTHEDNTVFTFELGKGSVIKAWDIAVKTMKVGEIAKITCKPEYAYGSAGSPPDIPPDATLVFEVELVACRPRKGSSLGSVSDERARLEELKKQREMAAAAKEEEKRKREEAKAAAAARVQAKLEAKKGQGKGKAKAK